jgi:hypothetical protein
MATQLLSEDRPVERPPLLMTRNSLRSILIHHLLDSPIDRISFLCYSLFSSYHTLGLIEAFPRKSPYALMIMHVLTSIISNIEHAHIRQNAENLTPLWNIIQYVLRTPALYLIFNEMFNLLLVRIEESHSNDPSFGIHTPSFTYLVKRLICEIKFPIARIINEHNVNVHEPPFPISKFLTSLSVCETIPFCEQSAISSPFAKSLTISKYFASSPNSDYHFEDPLAQLQSVPQPFIDYEPAERSEIVLTSTHPVHVLTPRFPYIEQIPYNSPTLCTVPKDNALFKLLTFDYFSFESSIPNISFNEFNRLDINHQIQVILPAKKMTHGFRITPSHVLSAFSQEETANRVLTRFSLERKDKLTALQTLATLFLEEINKLARYASIHCEFNSSCKRTEIEMILELVTQSSFTSNATPQEQRKFRERLASSFLSSVLPNSFEYGKINQLPLLLQAFPQLLDLDLMLPQQAIERLFEFFSTFLLNESQTPEMTRMIDLSPAKILRLIPPNVLTTLVSREVIQSLPTSEDLFLPSLPSQVLDFPENPLAWKQVVEITMRCQHRFRPSLNITFTRDEDNSHNHQELRRILAKRENLLHHGTTSFSRNALFLPKKVNPKANSSSMTYRTLPCFE